MKIFNRNLRIIRMFLREARIRINLENLIIIKAQTKEIALDKQI